MTKWTLLGLLLLAAAARAQDYRESFDAPPAGWTLDGGALPQDARWAFDTTPADFPSGPSRDGNSLNFNNGQDYAGCAAGSATSPSISLGALQHPVLRFWCNYQTETRGTAFDRRSVEIWSRDGKTLLAGWQLASTGYSFDRAGGLVGIGPGPCGEAYTDLESGVPVAAWHEHKIHLDPAWGDVRVRFVFWSVDDARNGYAGWAVDDLFVGSHPTPPPAGWPDVFPDTALDELPVPDGNELDTCIRSGSKLLWSWGTTNRGDPGVHLVIGNHPDAILGPSYLYFDALHGHLHFSQYADFTLWADVAGEGLVKLRRGPKRSFCLTDSERLGTDPSVSPGCEAGYQAISYNWQDVYALFTPGQEIDVVGLANDRDYWLVGTIDPLNRLRETNDANQTDQIHFVLTAQNGQVGILDRDNPYPPTGTALTITSATLGTNRGEPAVHVFGTGFDTTLFPILYDAGTEVDEAPFLTIVGPTEIWIQVPAAVAAPASLDLVRPDGAAASARIGGGAPVACPEPAAPRLVYATIDGPVVVLGVAPLPVTFQGSGGSASAPLEHTWDFGDGSAPETVTGVGDGASTAVEHTYAVPGNYVVRLTVRDADGATDERTATVAVAPFVPPPSDSGGGCGTLGVETPLLWGVLLLLRRRKRRSR